MIGVLGSPGVLGFSTSPAPRSIGTARPRSIGTARTALARSFSPAVAAAAAQGGRVIVHAPDLGPKVRGGGNGLPGSVSGSANDAIAPAPAPDIYHPGLDPATSGPSAGGGGASGGEGATDPGGDAPHGSTFGVSATFPTWALVAGGVVFAGLAVFALHRVLPAKRGGSKKAA